MSLNFLAIAHYSHFTHLREELGRRWAPILGPHTSSQGPGARKHLVRSAGNTVAPPANPPLGLRKHGHHHCHHLPPLPPALDPSSHGLPRPDPRGLAGTPTNSSFSAQPHQCWAVSAPSMSGWPHEALENFSELLRVIFFFLVKPMFF